MAGNSIGELFKVTTFGESHGVAIGAVIDGCPAGLEIDESFVQHQLDRRKPGQSVITTQRNESDKIHILSGVFEGKTLGTPICLLINNTDAKPQDYEEMKNIFRPSHADYTYEAKYGMRDYRGGGRSSARVTASSVAAGAFAQLLLKQAGLTITAYVKEVGKIKLEKNYSEIDLNNVDSNLVRCPDEIIAQKMQEEIMKAKAEGDSLGGIISCVIKNVPIGLGEPVFDKLQADLAKAIFSINAVHGFEYGSGFAGSAMKGSEHNDAFEMKLGIPFTKTNFSGGIQGGISNGMDIYFNVAFKPTATISKIQTTINSEGEEVELEAKGRHDPCVLPRAVPIVEAMTAIVLADFYLRNNISRY